MIGPLYMLDTDIASKSTKPGFRRIRQRLNQLDPAEYLISVITRAELLYGLQRVSPDHPAQSRIRRLLNDVTILDWTQEAADVHARIRHGLDIQGRPLQMMDLLIAAHAILIDAILITNNTRHFERLSPMLTIENWVEET